MAGKTEANRATEEPGSRATAGLDFQGVLLIKGEFGLVKAEAAVLGASSAN